MTFYKSKWVASFLRNIILCGILFYASVSSAQTLQTINDPGPLAGWSNFSISGQTCSAGGAAIYTNCSSSSGVDSLAMLTGTPGTVGTVQITGLVVGTSYSLKLICGTSNTNANGTLTYSSGGGLTITGTTVFSNLPNVINSGTRYANCNTQFTADATTASLQMTLTGSGWVLNTNKIYIAQVSQSLTVAASPPTVTSLSPSSGTTAGGTTVAITGTNFTGATGVTIGGAAATSVNVVSATSITATTPVGTAGTASVVVTTPSGSNAANTLYTYVAPPVASAVSQTVAYNSSSNNITLSATNTPTSVAVSTQASHGTATASGTAITYTPTAGYFGTDTFQYTATNAGGTSSAATATITISPPSVDATLSTLALSSGTLSPTFASGTTSYTASVANSVSSITVTPTRNQVNATITVNGTAVTSGSASGSISLNVGSTTITTVVTAQDGTTTQTYTTTVTRAAATSNDATLSTLALSSGTLSPTFASGTTSYTASVANSASFITVTPTPNQSNATITVNGTAVTSGSASGSISLSVGSNVITTVVTAQDGTTTQTYTTTVTRAAALLQQASFTVSASPSTLNATTTTSTLSTTGGSGTGAVSYAMTAGTCTLSGTTVTAGTASETCTVTATKAADSTYLTATATVNITVSRRATLAAAATDASVAKTQATQMMQTQKFVQTQVQNITSHLDTFRHNFNLTPSNMGVSVVTPSMGPMTPLFYKVKDVWSGNSAESTASSLHKVGMKDAGQANGSGKPFNDYNNPDEIDEQAKIEERIYAYERKQETYSLWSAGTIDTGLFKTGDNKDISNKFRVNGLTFGLDYKVGPRAIIGAAFGIGQGTNASPELQSTVKSTQRSLSGYGMLGFGNNWVVDGLLGYSSLAFTGDRTTSDGAATLGMNRTGNSAFASTSISKIFSVGSLRIAPFLREDVTQIRLGQYAETGATDYALGYDTTRYTATTQSAGLHFSHDVYLDHGKLTTTAKFSGNRMKTGAIAQDVYYVDIGMAGGIYTLNQNSSYQSSRSLNLGIMYSNKAGDGIDIGWMGAMGANQYKLIGLRLGIRFAM